MSLPKGRRVFVYSMSKPDEYHALTKEPAPPRMGRFGRRLCPSDTVVIEYFAAPGLNRSARPSRYTEVSHTFKDFSSQTIRRELAILMYARVAECGQVSSSSTCITGDFVGICTGTLINDNDASTAIPYVLTAHHCTP